MNLLKDAGHTLLAGLVNYYLPKFLDWWNKRKTKHRRRRR